MKFAHLADCHLGCWGNPELQELSVKAFNYTIEECIKEKVDFVLITGDLFDTAMPSVRILNETTINLKKLNDNKISCYIIAGSHDFSISGNTFLSFLENAGLSVNIDRYTNDGNETKLEIFKKDNLVLAGIPGKKAGLEIKIINQIKHKNNKDNNLKILCLHTTLTEAKPKDMDIIESVDSNKLPEGFDYYAFGHLHLCFNRNINGKICVYPGPLFPANFSEFEDLKYGSFCIVHWGKEVNIYKREVKLKNVVNIKINADGRTPEQLSDTIINEIDNISKSIITLKIKGTLSRGKTSDINFSKFSELSIKNKNILLRNTNSLESQEFKAEIESEGKDISEIESNVIKKYGWREGYKEFSSIIENLMHSLELEKQEGEKKQTFDDRVINEISRIFGI